MKKIKTLIFTLLFICIALPVIYLCTAILLSYITVNPHQTIKKPINQQTIYLSSNGVHLDIILPKQNISTALAKDLVGMQAKNAAFFAFGWGDENFYLNTPTWGDLTVSNAFSALFLKSSSLMHVTRFAQPEKDWVAISLSPSQLKRLNHHILNSFQMSSHNKKIHLTNAGYSPQDDFYKAKGSYSVFYTCNTWANDLFKQSGLTASYWTPFDKGLLSKWQ